MPYAAILFDLFDTLVRFDRERMPEVEINGKTVRSSAGLLHAILKTQAPQVGLERCYEALGESWREAERLRSIDHREVSASERFAHFFQTLGLDQAALPSGFDRALIDAHRNALGAPPSSRPPRPLLRRLAELPARGRVELRLHPDALDILERAGVVGLRHDRRLRRSAGASPGAIFRRGARRLGVRADEAPSSETAPTWTCWARSRWHGRRVDQPRRRAAACRDREADLRDPRPAERPRS
jgi:hypothetical protein